MQFLRLISATIVLVSFANHAAELSLKTAEGFELKADYYPSSETANRAVLMLHQCNYNRSMYNEIGQQLAKRGIDALSLDFRGFGGSASQEFSMEDIQALPQDQRRPAWRAMATYWPTDVQLAYNYLKSKLKEEAQIAVIGASCGGSQAITLAENHPIAAMGFFSSGQNEQNITRYKNTLADKPTLIIAAEEDGNTYTSAKALFVAAQHANSKFISYKGAQHGYPLLDSDPDLAGMIVNWFDRQLVE